jgi:hypothetical protein
VNSGLPVDRVDAEQATLDATLPLCLVMTFYVGSDHEEIEGISLHGTDRVRMGMCHCDDNNLFM